MIPYRHGLLAAVMIGIASPASAASIIVTALGPVGGTGSNVVWLSGEIKQGDETVFAALPTTYSLVTLSSNGGQAVAAMLIGKTIRQRGWSTAVIHSTCASSCAMIWLGGTHRFRTRDAKVGFHGAYDAVTHAVSGPANAVIGMYMHELGYPVEAAIYVTTATPENIAWLTEADGKRVGISAEISEELASPPPPSTGSTSSGSVPAPAAAPAVVPVADPVAPSTASNPPKVKPVTKAKTKKMKPWERRRDFSQKAN
jgi:hypothetical protein